MGHIRILRVVTRLNIGGPAFHLVTLVGGLDPSRYEQWLVAGTEGPGEGSLRSFVESRGVRVIPLPSMVGVPRLGGRDPMALAKLCGLIRDLRPDIVETHTSKAGVLGRIAARLDGRPIVVHVYHGHVLSGYFGTTKSWAARRTERALAAISDHLVAVSANVKADLIAYRVAPAAKISVIEPGIEAAALPQSRVARGRLRQELAVPMSVPLIGIVGRLAPIKNPTLFVDAAAITLSRRPDARFVVVGDGEQASQIRSYAYRRLPQSSVVFTGWRHDLAAVYADLDVLVLSSNREGLPLTLVEAMIAGCPVVATAVGGVPDLITNDITGLLVPPLDPERMSAAILRLIEDRQFAATVAAAAQRETRARFGADRFVTAMDGLYGRLLADRGSVRFQSGRTRKAAHRVSLRG